MPVPPQVLRKLKAKYPKPTVDEDWLSACYEWVIGDSDLNPTTQTDEIVKQVEGQLLQSDLDDSMVAHTGFPANVNELHDTRLSPTQPILCQINAITEIGHSAFSLQNVRQTRIDREDLAGLVEAGVEDEEESQPIPNYPRATLRFELSDGSVTVRAMEYKRLPGLELGVTPLGFKLLLKNVLMRRGIAFLEPSNTTLLKDSQTDEREMVQDKDFARGLRVRLGQPEPESDSDDERPPQAQPPGPPPPAANQAQRQPHRAASPVPRPRVSPAPAVKAEAVGDDSVDYFSATDELDDEYLRELEAIEQQHARETQTQRGATDNVWSANLRDAVDTDSDIEMDDTQTTAVNGVPRRKPPAAPKRGRARPEEVIEISD